MRHDEAALLSEGIIVAEQRVGKSPSRIARVCRIHLEVVGAELIVGGTLILGSEFHEKAGLDRVPSRHLRQVVREVSNRLFVNVRKRRVIRRPARSIRNTGISKAESGDQLIRIGVGIKSRSQTPARPVGPVEWTVRLGETLRQEVLAFAEDELVGHGGADYADKIERVRSFAVRRGIIRP